MLQIGFVDSSKQTVSWEPILSEYCCILLVSHDHFLSPSPKEFYDYEKAPFAISPFCKERSVRLSALPPEVLHFFQLP